MVNRTITGRVNMTPTTDGQWHHQQDYRQRWARLLKQQSSITVSRSTTKEKNFRFPFPFAANKCKFAVSIFCLQQTNGSCCFLLVLFFACIYTVPIYIYAANNQKFTVFRLFAANGKTERQTYLCCGFNIYINIQKTEIYIYMLPFQTENGSPGDFH